MIRILGELIIHDLDVIEVIKVCVLFLVLYRAVPLLMLTIAWMG